MAGLFSSVGLSSVRSESRVLLVRDATGLDGVFGLRTWARSAQAVGLLSDREVLRWETLLDEIVASGSFSWKVTYYVTTGIRSP